MKTKHTRDKGKLCRNESNKIILQLLNEYDIDTSLIEFNTSGNTVSLHGTLLYSDGEDLAPETVEELVREMQRVGRVTTNLSNWDLNNGNVIHKHNLSGRAA